jgi:hypothetical protein
MLVPLLILLFNVLVIHEARRLAKFEKHQLKSHAKSHGNATTVMLLAVSFYQIFTTLPVTIIVTLYVVYTEDSCFNTCIFRIPRQHGIFLAMTEYSFNKTNKLFSEYFTRY